MLPSTGFVCLAAGLAFAEVDGALDLDKHTHIFIEAAETADSKPNTFATLTAARDAIRAGLGQNTTRTVFLAGEHFLETTFELGPEDSGTHQHPINYRSAPGGGARLTGGVTVPVSAFESATVPSGAKGVVKAHLFACCGLNSSVLGKMACPHPNAKAELFYDHVPSVLARHPNISPNGTWLWSGYENLTNPSDMSFDLADQEAVTRFLQPALANNGSLWLHGFWKFDWRDTYIKIASIEKAKSTTGSYTVTRDAATKPQYNFTKGCRFYALDSLALLDAPNEYYISEDGWLYFLPPVPLSSTPNVDIKVSVRESLVTINGANHTSLHGLVLSDSRNTGLQVTNAKGVHITNLTVANTGGGCISLSGANSTVSSSLVYGCGLSGVAIDGGNLDTLEHGSLSVVGNHIFNFSRIVRTYQPGVAFLGVGLYVANNTIQNGPHTAITGGGNNNLFEYNTISHACYECTDTGAFYVGRSWSQRGNVVRFNTFDTIKPTERLAQKSCSQNAFYLDDQMSGYDFYGNTIINATTGILLGGGRRNRIHSNRFVDNDLDIAFDNRGMNWMADYCNYNCTGYKPKPAQQAGCFRTKLEALHYKQPPYSTAYPELVDLYDYHPCVPVDNVVEDNTYCHSRSGNASSGHIGFIDRTPEQIRAWYSSISNNRRVC